MFHSHGKVTNNMAINAQGRKPCRTGVSRRTSRSLSWTLLLALSIWLTPAAVHAQDDGGTVGDLLMQLQELKGAGVFDRLKANQAPSNLDLARQRGAAAIKKLGEKPPVNLLSRKPTRGA